MRFLKISIFHVILILILLTPQLLMAASSEAPQKAIASLLAEIKQIKKGDDLSKAQRQANQEHADRALTFLDIGEVSKKALGKHWKKISEKEQRDFTQLLGQLFIHVAFPNSGKFFASLKIEYGETLIEENKSVVPISVTHEKEGEVGIEFHMIEKNKHWLVTDVLLDDVSMRNNLRSQFYKIIAKKKFADLMKRMNKKLKESM
jgi:phospholipid transport system substrate-binding protein